MKRFAIISLSLIILFNANIVLAATKEELQLFNMINYERAKKKLPKYILDSKLCTAAKKYADYMSTVPLNNKNLSMYYNAEHINYKNNTSYKTRIKEAYPEVSGFSENIDIADSVAMCHRELMNSSIHKYNVLNRDYIYIGISISRVRLNGKEKVLVVEEFVVDRTKKDEKERLRFW